MRTRLCIAVAVVIVSALFVPVYASGAPIVIHASGVWNPSAPVSELTAPGATWSFSFTTDDHPEIEGFWDTGFNPAFEAFEYRLDEGSVPAAPAIALNGDASLVVSQSFTGTILYVDAVAVPEPATIGLTGIAMAGLYLRRSQVRRTARRSVRSCGTSASRSSVRNS